MKEENKTKIKKPPILFKETQAILSKIEKKMDMPTLNYRGRSDLILINPTPITWFHLVKSVSFFH